MADQDSFAAMLRRIVRRMLPGKSTSVRVVHETNIDGEAVKRVFIAYDASKEGPTVEQMSTITDEIWREIIRGGDGSVVVPSFVSLEDEKSLSAA